MLRRSLDKSSLPSINTSPSQLPERYTATNHSQHGMMHQSHDNKSPTIKRLNSTGGSKPTTPSTPLIRKAFSVDAETILSAPIIRGDPNSAINVIATKKAEYTKSRLMCEYLQFFCEVVSGSMSLDAVQSLFADPIIITEINPHILKLMDMFEKFIRNAGFSDIVQWFDSVVSRGDHSLIGLIPYNLFSAELLILAIGSGNQIVDERDVRTLFCHLNDCQSIEAHLSRNSLHVAYKMKRISPKNARRLNSIAQLLKNIHFILKNTHTSLQDYRGKKHRLKSSELRSIGVVELEQVLSAILAQYSAVLNGDAPNPEEPSIVVPNTRGSFLFADITHQDFASYGIPVSPPKTESPEAESSPVHKTLSRVSYSPFTQSLDDGFNATERPVETDEEDGEESTSKKINDNSNNNDQAENEIINENFAQYFDAEERRLLHNLVKHIQEGEREGEKKLPSLPRTTFMAGASSSMMAPSGSILLVNPNGGNNSRPSSRAGYERRNSVMRKTMIKNNLKSFHAYVEQQEVHKNPEPIQNDQPMFTLFGEAPLSSSTNSNHQKTKRSGLTMEEIIQKNLDNLTGHKNSHNNHDRRPKTSQGLVTVGPPTIQLNGCTLPSHEKILQTFDNRLDFVRTSMNRYR